MDKSKTEALKDIFRSYPDVKLAYIFGSRATGEAGPLSDYDFAVYFDLKDKISLVGWAEPTSCRSNPFRPPLVSKVRSKTKTARV